MLRKNFVKIYITTEKNILERMKPTGKDNLRTGDFFLEEVLASYIEGFSIKDITRNEHGKPGIQSSNISFNLSHSEDNYALILCDSPYCGVDIQVMKSLLKFENALKSVLTDREFSILTENSSDKAFFQLWSVKEAFIKATGGSIWYGRDYDFSGILPDYSNRWIPVHEQFLYSTEIVPGTYLSFFTPLLPESLEFFNF
jgi:phosphopantetheinyl transferase